MMYCICTVPLHLVTSLKLPPHHHRLCARVWGSMTLSSVHWRDAADTNFSRFVLKVNNLTSFSAAKTTLKMPLTVQPFSQVRQSKPNTKKYTSTLTFVLLLSY